MIKVLAAKEMARVEALALKAGASEEAWIRRAGEQISKAASEWVIQQNLEKRVAILAGRGNNGADGLAAGICLLRDGFQAVAHLIAPLKETDEFYQQLAKEFESQGGSLLPIQSKGDLRFEGSFILDGLFGTGFRGEVKGLPKRAIEAANRSRLPILAVDIPSGIDGSTGKIGTVAIKAVKTFAMGLPKIGCFLKDAWNYVGKLEVLDFGLPRKWIAEAKEDAWIAEKQDLKNMLPELVRNRHKYQAGFVLGYAGSVRYSGAAKLASLSALRSGVGIVKLFYPSGAEQNMVCMPYEIVHSPWDETLWNLEIKKADAVFVGSGIGQTKENEEWLKKQLPFIRCPVVLDADALMPWVKIPPNSICTPHRKEMLRLLGKKELSEEALFKACQRFCNARKTVIVLKGAPTWIFRPNESPYLITQGDPGMATAGTGDVLTGLLASLLAQGCKAEEAALLGAAIHALAGEISAQKQTSYCMVASDLIDAFSEAFSDFSVK